MPPRGFLSPQGADNHIDVVLHLGGIGTLLSELVTERALDGDEIAGDHRVQAARELEDVGVALGGRHG
jgi:hypothetical protein